MSDACRYRPDTHVQGMAKASPPPSTAQTREELQELLAEQLQALKASCAAFDRGSHWEAKRIATAIRVLAHNTAQSHALLYQLALDTRGYLNTSPPIDELNLLPQRGLLALALHREQGMFLPALDEMGGEFTDLRSWWEEPVVWDRADARFSRKELTLFLSNKDGGAHVDPSLPDAYRSLKTGAMGWTFSGKSAKSPELFAMRQIGHEMTKSLDPGYTRSPVKPKQDFMMVARAELRQGAQPSRDWPPVSYHRTPSTDPCPCRSGKPFGQCHLAGAREPKLPKTG